jgi:hypothetical protein
MAPSHHPPPPKPKDKATIYSLIHELHRTITKSIDTSLSWDQLNSPPVNYTLVRPIVERFCHPLAVVEGDVKKRNEFLGVPDGGESGAGSGAGARISGAGLGMVLFALMANRYASSLPLLIIHLLG